MTLSTSRQQFLAYESHAPEDIQYSRRGGIFVSTCICVSYIILAVILAAVVGVIVYFITFYKLSQVKSGTDDVWDDGEPFGQPSPSSDLRLPAYVAPSFYRLKLRTDINNSNFTGEVYITIRANKPVKEIILHAKNLTINGNAKLTEQIYEKVETIHGISKRDVNTDSANITNSTENIFNITETAQNNNESAEIKTTTANNIEDNGTVSMSNNIETTTQTVTQQQTPVPIDTQVTHSSVRNIKIISITEATGDRLILKLASALSKNVDYTLQLSFSGQISNALTGFYLSSYKNVQKEEKKLGVTQFEPTSARAAFPCFDEPAFKAMFEISIAHPESYTALSNMKVSSEELIAEEPGWKWTHFERSVNMSTYLVAYILSDFKSLETSYLSKDNITKQIRIWARPELINQVHYALNITPTLLSYYEDVFGVPYALDKLDLIAVPDFSSGAMENWGLITFRETALLYDPMESTPRDKQVVAIDVAHELAHQWFGNLVTMRWWTDLWLNEGFATYIEYIGVDRIEPDWMMFKQFARDKMELHRSDALKNTSPVSRKVVDASEISQKFDEISYTKGANLIRMLNHTISEELFHKGLVIYLNQWKYSNAEENDLWQAMSQATATEPTLTDLSVVEFMNSWTRQAGYPVLSVNRNYEKGIVEIEQRLFTSAQSPYQSMVDQLWQIPISYVGLGSPDAEWSTKPKLWLKKRFQVVSLPVNSSEALYVNVDAIGYYRVNYDKRNWELLSDALRGEGGGRVRSAVARAQLIDDAFNLAKVGQLDYNYALGLTACVMNGEDDRIVWEMLLNNMGFLKYNLMSTPGYVHFQDYMRIILKKQLERLNYGLDKPKDENEAFLIENLLSWECTMESPRCLDWAAQQFRNWMNQTDINNNPIPNHLRSLVYSTALKFGGRREFEFLWRVFQEASDPAARAAAASALPSTRGEGLIAMLLERSITTIPKQYAVAMWALEPPLGTRTAQAFLADNFDRVYDRFSNMDAFMFPAVLSGAFGFVNREDELNKLKSLALAHAEQLRPLSQALQKLVDTGAARLLWARTHAATVAAWFTVHHHHRTGQNATFQNTTDTLADAPQNITSNEKSNLTNANVPIDSASIPNADSNLPVTEGNVTTPTSNEKSEANIPNTNSTETG